MTVIFMKAMTHTKLFFLLLLFPLVLLSACGYTLEGSNPLLPKGAKSIAILPIQNQTFQSGMETRLTQDLRTLFRNNASVHLSTSAKQADLTLEIILKNLTRKRSNIEDTVNTTTGIIFTLSGDVTLKNQRAQKTVWKVKNFSAQATTSSDDVSELSGLLITRGFREVSQLFAQQIYDRIFLNF